MGFFGYGWTGPCAVTDRLCAEIILYGLAAHLILHYALRALITRLGPYEFTKRVRSKGLTQSEFARDASYNVQGFLLHAVQGPVAAYLSWTAVGRAPRPPWPAMCAQHERPTYPAPRPRTCVPAHATRACRAQRGRGLGRLPRHEPGDADGPLHDELGPLPDRSRRARRRARHRQLRAPRARARDGDPLAVLQRVRRAHPLRHRYGGTSETAAPLLTPLARLLPRARAFDRAAYPRGVRGRRARPLST